MWIHKYLLQPVDSLNSRSKQQARMGFLIKNENASINQKEASTEELLKLFQNYSDFIHWPELGDPELSELKSTLIKTAESDFKFPFNLIEKDLVSVKSNALVSRYDKMLGQEMEILQDGKFEVLKFKMGRAFKDEYTALMKLNLKSYLVRIDFNNSLNFKEAKEALEMLKKVPNLEYIEDPTEYGDYHWSELEKIAPIALDHFAEQLPIHPNAPKAKEPIHFQFRILKPMRGVSTAKIMEWTIQKKKIVLTNLMDSAVGTWKTYLYYCELKKQFPYHVITPGFHTHTLFSNYQHVELLGFDGALWNFDKQKLEKLTAALDKKSWIKLNYTDNKSIEQVLEEAEAYQ